MCHVPNLHVKTTMTTNILTKKVKISVYYKTYSSSHTPPTVYEYNKGQSMGYSHSTARAAHHIAYSRERNCQGANALERTKGNESSRAGSLSGERMFQKAIQAAKVPGSKLARVLLKLSLQGANWPDTEMKRVGTSSTESKRGQGQMQNLR